MAIIYDDNKESSGRSPVPYEKWDAKKHFLAHFENYMYLKFIFMNSRDGREKSQASKELAIAEKKMDYWKRHPNYTRDRQQIDESVQKIKSTWLGR